MTKCIDLNVFSLVYISSRFLFFLARRGHAPSFLGTLISRQNTRTLLQARPIRNGDNGQRSRENRLVIPIFGVLVATLFAFLAFLPSQSPTAEQVGLLKNERPRKFTENIMRTGILLALQYDICCCHVIVDGYDGYVW